MDERVLLRSVPLAPHSHCNAGLADLPAKDKREAVRDDRRLLDLLWATCCRGDLCAETAG